jgi:hypothetical protein
VPVAVFCPVFVLQKIRIKRSPNAAKLFVDIFGPEDNRGSEEEIGDEARGGEHPLGRATGASHGPGVLAPSVPYSTASSLYKFPKIPETLGVPPKHNSSRHKFQNHQIQSRHHLEGFHHVHWCLSDDA